MPNTDTPSAEALADTLDAMAGPMRGNGENPEFDAIFEPRAKALEDAAAVLRTLSADNANLRTVMVAAAEEIHAHWEAHCDAEGYGPANLMHRLEQGIPAQYGYTAGRFAELVAERDALRAELDAERKHRADMRTALRLAREGYASEAITGLPVLQTWRERTLARIDAALQRTAATPPQQEPTV